MCARVAALLLLLLLTAGGRAQAQRPRYTLVVQVDARRAALSGAARITLVNTSGATLTEVPLWLYAQRFAVRSEALNDFNFYWVYPYRFNAAAVRVRSVRAGGQDLAARLEDHPLAGPETLLVVSLARPCEPGQQIELEIGYQLHIPDRYGSFGCFRDTCVLGGGFYPMLPPFKHVDSRTGAGQGAFDLSAPPARADFALTVRAPGAAELLIQGQRHALGGAQALEAALTDERAVTLVVSRRAFRTVSLEHRGVRVIYHLKAPRPVQSPASFVVPYWPADREGQVLATARRALDVLATEELPLPVGETLHLFEGALRTEVAQALPGAVLVSDRAFDVFPLGAFQSAHERALARAIFELYAARRVTGHERPDDEGWAPDVAASLLAERYAEHREREKTSAVVAKLGFLPEADRILYAPQVPFASTYFPTLADPDPLRDSLTQFNNDRPRGLTLYFKLSDLLDDRQRELRIVRAQLHGTPLRAAAEAVYGGDLGWFFRQWLGPYPAVDYRLRQVRSARAGARTEVVVIVDKIGENPPIEPVTLWARDRRGGVYTQRWDGQGRVHEYRFTMAAPLAEIQLDPHGRLQQARPGSNDDPRFGERLPPRWKFLLAKTSLSAGSNTVDIEQDFTLARVRDLKHSILLAVLHNELLTAGVAALYQRSFGAKATPARLDGRVSTGLMVARVPSLGSEPGGESLTASVGLSWDDRLYLWEPVRATSLSLTASYTLTVLDSAAVASRGNISASAASILPLADGHGLAFLLSGGVTFGDIAAPQQLISSGGATGLRAFALEDLLGRASLIGRAEYRHVFIHSLNLNLLSTYYLRGVGGTLFAEAALTSACSSYALDRSSVATDVGYGVNFIAEWLGFTANVIGFSIAVPVQSPARECLGLHSSHPGQSPVTFFFTFGPSW